MCNLITNHALLPPNLTYIFKASWVNHTFVSYHRITGALVHESDGCAIKRYVNLVMLT